MTTIRAASISDFGQEIQEVRPVKIKTEPLKFEDLTVPKKEWRDKIIIPMIVGVIIIIGGIILGNLTTKTRTEMLLSDQKLQGELVRVEQKVDDFMIREQEHFNILLEELRIIRGE